MDRLETLRKLAQESEARVKVSDCSTCISVIFDEENFLMLPDFNTLDQNVEQAIEYINDKNKEDRYFKAQAIAQFELQFLSANISWETFEEKVKEVEKCK